MKTKTQAALLLTPVDEQLITRGMRGIYFQTYRKLAGLSLTEASNLLKQKGIHIPVAVLSLFERGGTDRKGTFVADIRGHKIDFRPEVLSRLEELYNIPKDKRLEHNPEGYAKLLEDKAIQSVMRPILGRTPGFLDGFMEKISPMPAPLLGEKPNTELQSLRLENSILKSQNEKHKRHIVILEETIAKLEELLNPSGKVSAGYAALLSSFGIAPPEGSGEKLLGKSQRRKKTDAA